VRPERGVRGSGGDCASGSLHEVSCNHLEKLADAVDLGASGHGWQNDKQTKDGQKLK
jgi:hypothetical protein